MALLFLLLQWRLCSRRGKQPGPAVLQFRAAGRPGELPLWERPPGTCPSRGLWEFVERLAALTPQHPFKRESKERPRCCPLSGQGPAGPGAVPGGPCQGQRAEEGQGEGEASQLNLANQFVHLWNEAGCLCDCICVPYLCDGEAGPGAAPAQPRMLSTALPPPPRPPPNWVGQSPSPPSLLPFTHSSLGATGPHPTSQRRKQGSELRDCRLLQGRNRPRPLQSVWTSGLWVGLGAVGAGNGGGRWGTPRPWVVAGSWGSCCSPQTHPSQASSHPQGPCEPGPPPRCSASRPRRGAWAAVSALPLPSQRRREAALTWWFWPCLGARACPCTPARSPALKGVPRSVPTPARPQLFPGPGHRGAPS